MFNQGIVVYSTSLPPGKFHYSIVIHDYALIYLDNELIEIIDRSIEKYVEFKGECKMNNCELMILVEAMGHINFGS